MIQYTVAGLDAKSRQAEHVVTSFVAFTGQFIDKQKQLMKKSGLCNRYS